MEFLQVSLIPVRTHPLKNLNFRFFHPPYDDIMITCGKIIANVLLRICSIEGFRLQRMWYCKAFVLNCVFKLFKKFSLICKRYPLKCNFENIILMTVFHQQCSRDPKCIWGVCVRNDKRTLAFCSTCLLLPMLVAALILVLNSAVSRFTALPLTEASAVPALRDIWNIRFDQG